MKLRCRKVVEDEEFKPLKHYLLAWIAFLSWVTVLGFLRALMWVLAIRSSGKAPILVDINDRPLRKTPPQWGIWSIKMPIMEFLERSSIFSGFFVCVVRAGTWCPRLNLWGLWFIYTGECRASFTFIQAIHFHGLVTYNGPYMAGTRVSMSPSPPSDESKALIHLLYWGLWMLESRNRLSHSLHRLDFGDGGFGWLSPAPACFIHFLFSLISPIHFGSFTFATVQSAYITPWAFRKITASFGNTLGTYPIVEAYWPCTDHSSHNSGKSMHTLLSHSLMAAQHRIGGKRRYLLYKLCHLSVKSFTCSASCSSWSNSVALSSVLHKPIPFPVLRS